MFSCIIAKHAVFENLVCNYRFQRHHPIENIRSRTSASFLSMYFIIHDETIFYSFNISL
jgi:hypothetical protein